MNSANIVDALIKDIEERLTLDGKNRVFNEGKELRSEFMNEEAEPEAFTREFLIDKIFSALELEKLPEKKIEDSRGLRSVDYRIKSKRGMFLVEAKPLNADLFEKSRDGGVNQIKGLFKLAEVKENYDFGVATNGLRWVFIDRTGKIVDDLRLEADFAQIKEFLVGKEKVVSPKTEEEISKKFYDWYNALLHGGRYKDHENKLKTVAEADCLVSNVIGVSDLEEREQIAQVVMNRLIFIKFLQSKGIIGEDILRYLSEVKEDLLTPKLRQLFFGTLDRPEDERFDIDERFKDIPYLNGSLFVHTEVERKNIDYKVRAEILKKVIEFLDSFKFVHKEQFENEDSIDPEILGYIFERAMTATDRKGTGAYYTPKPITKYISENTIYSYIIEKTNEFLKTERGYKEGDLLTDIKELFILAETTLNAIWNNVILKIRVLDNACGSGAFLLAAANILFELSRKINDKLGLGNSDTALKKLILINNLHGVDINPNGIEIAKLRLWLWLVDSYEPERVEPLPNIDYNLRVGNSLIGYVDISELSETKLNLLIYLLNDEEITLDKRLNERNNLIREYKRAEGEQAKELKGKLNVFDEKINDLLNADLYRGLREKKIKISKEEFFKLKPFHWGFEFYEVFDSAKPKEERGFDVVIGNPPYGDILKDVERGWIKKTFPFKTTVTDQNGKGSVNAASVFIERSNLLLKKDSRFGYIVPNSISRTDEFLKIRSFLMDDVYLYNIVDEGSPFVGVTLEMISIFYKNKKFEKDYEINIFSRRKNVDKVNNLVNKSIFSKYSRFIFYWDRLWETITKDSFLNFLDGKRGITILPNLLSNTKDKSHEIPVLVSGKCVSRYHLIPEKFHWGNNLILTSNEAKKSYDRDMLVSVRLSSEYRVAIKPKGFVAADNVIRLIFDESKVDGRYITLLLNSSLMRYITWKYLSNCINLTMFINAVTSSTPIKLAKSQTPFITLCNYMLFLNETEERRKNEKELIEFVDKQVIDSLIYELYFKEKFEEEGLKTNLLGLVEHYLEDIENLKSEEEKLKVIKEVVEKIKGDRKVKREIEKIKNHEWVKIIEGERNSLEKDIDRTLVVIGNNLNNERNKE